MCGIAGWFKVAETTPEQDKTIFEIGTKLFAETNQRGRDASGFSYFKKVNNELVTVKGPVTSDEMIRNPLWLKLADAVPSSIIMHCRAMTKGSEYDNMNNHPLVIDKRISVVHNGGIWNDDDLRAQFKLPSKGQVDSEVIPMLIDKYLGDLQRVKMPKSVLNAKAVSLTSQTIVGSYACAMINRDVPNLMYLFNHKNPVTLAYVESLNVMFFASTKYILEKAFEIKGNTDKAFGIFDRVKHKPLIYEVPEDTLIVLGVYDKTINQEDILVKDATCLEKTFSITLYELNTNPDAPYTKASMKKLVISEDELKKLLVKKDFNKKVTTTSYPASAGAAARTGNGYNGNWPSRRAVAGYPGQDDEIDGEGYAYLLSHGI